MKVSTSGPLNKLIVTSSSSPTIRFPQQLQTSMLPSNQLKTSIYALGLGEEDVLPPQASISPEKFRRLSSHFDQQQVECEEKKRQKRLNRKKALIRQEGCDDEQRLMSSLPSSSNSNNTPPANVFSSSQSQHPKCPETTVSVNFSSNIVPEVISKIPSNSSESKLTEQPLKLGNKKSRVRFGTVDLYEFDFAQGVDTVPTAGSVSLGMEAKHHSKHKFRLEDYPNYKNIKNRMKYSNWNLASNALLAMWTNRQKRKLEQPIASGHGETAENNEDKSTATIQNKAGKKQAKCKDVERESGSDEFDEESEEEGRVFFEQCRVFEPLRRYILRNRGIPIDETVTANTLKVVESRSKCGCRCRGGKCRPNTCECAKEGIKCQVDITDVTDPTNNYPCGCTAKGCQNPEGRIELDSTRIQSHIHQTLMRIEAAAKKGLDWSNSPQHTFFAEVDVNKAVNVRSCSNVQQRPDEMKQISCPPSSKIQSPDPFVTIRKKRPTSTISIQKQQQISLAKDPVKRSIDVQEEPVTPEPDPSPFPTSKSMLLSVDKNTSKRGRCANADPPDGSPFITKRQKK